MMVGTLAILHYELRTGPHGRALTIAFTTFVLFQLFNVLNARVEDGSVFHKRFFDNPVLWLAMAGVLALQVLVIHWPPAQSLVDLSSLSPKDWALAAGVASSVLLLEEARKLFARVLRNLRGHIKSVTA
jgi:Ca2+-transporting ATPase